MAYEVTCYERKHEVAVVGAAPFVDDDHAIAITVERESGIGFVVDDKPLECLRSGRTAALVDVLAVGFVEVRENFRAGLRENSGRHAIGRPVRAIERDTHPREARRLGHEERLVLLHQRARVTDEADAALRGARKRVVAGHERFDPVLDAVRELLRAVIEELDAVVGRRIVRRADDRSGDELIGLREERQPGSRNVADETHLHADRAESRGERALEHAATPAGVAADHDRVPRPTEDVARRPTKPKRELRCEIEIRHATNAIRTEEPGQAVPDYLVRMVSVTRIGCTLWAVVPAGVRMPTSTG